MRIFSIFKIEEPVAPIIIKAMPMCANDWEKIFKGIFFITTFGDREINFENSNRELIIIHADRIKKIIDRIGPPKFKYHTNNETKTKTISKMESRLRRFIMSSFPHLIKGPNIIPKVTGNINGERIELTHRAVDRKIFSNGALKAAIWIFNKKPGMYSLTDMLG